MVPEQLPLAKRVVLRALETAGVAPQLMDGRDRARYALDREARQRNARFTAPDGMPMPPAHLIHKVVGHFDYDVFYRGGETRFAYLQEVIRRGGASLQMPAAVLDWGCGSGRVLRQWRQLDGVQVYGSDYNPDLVAWCREAFAFARLSTNGLAPPLAFPDDCFDFLYGISVFTHLDEPLQIPWIEELRRVVKPGGLILVTVNGVVGSRDLVGAERERFDAGQLVVIGEQFQGRNYCAVVHPDAYVRKVLGRDLEVLAVVPASDPEFDHGQDGYLLRVP